MRGERILKGVVVLSIVVILVGDLVFAMFPYLFMNRHTPGYVLNNAILDWSTIVAAAAGVCCAVALGLGTKRAAWFVSAGIVAVLFVASFFIGILFWGGKM